MNKHDLQLTLDQRYPIGVLYHSGQTQQEIARKVEVHYNTISRELK